MTDDSASASTSLSELVEEGGEFLLKDISGGATLRYVRIYYASFYRFEDVTDLLMRELTLPLVRACGMHTAAVRGTDADLVQRIRDTTKTTTPPVPQPSPRKPPPPAGGRSVRAAKPSPTRPPRGGAVLTRRK